MVYSDGDREHLDCDELLAVLQVSRAHKEWIATAYRDLTAALNESKKAYRNEYLLRPILTKKQVTWFGITLMDAPSKVVLLLA